MDDDSGKNKPNVGFLKKGESDPLGNWAGLSEVAAVVVNSPFPDELVKGMVGAAIKTMFPVNTVSTALMHRCIDSDMSEFTEKDMIAISADYEAVMREAVRAGMQAKGVAQLKAGQTIVIELPSDFMVNDLLGQESVQSEEHLKVLAEDLGRALRHVRLTGNEDGSITLTDHFDFSPPDLSGTSLTEPSDSAKDLLKVALETDSALTRGVAIGRMFCQEADKNIPSSSSVPIRITVSAKDVAER